MIARHQRSFSARRRRDTGYTLAEMLVATLVFSLILLGALQLFDFNTKIAKAQLQLTEVQQGQRIAQQELVCALRSAGRGPLPILQPPTGPYAGRLLPDSGLAISVQNNVPVDTCFIDCTTIRVAPGTDVLTVRGILTASLLQAVPTSAVFNPTARTLIVSNPSPTGIPQNLSALREAIQQNRQEALVMVSPLADTLYAVVQLDPSTSTLDSADQITISYVPSGNEVSDRYRELAPGGVFPANFTAVVSVGILEEYRYFVQEVGDSRKLTRGRFYPNSDVPWGATVANARAELVDNILDLQVALGLDVGDVGPGRDGSGAADGSIAEATPGTRLDDWLFNAADDTPVDSDRWNVQPTARVGYVRLTTLARTERRDLGYVAPPITNIEDAIYNEPARPADDTQRDRRMFRRRLLRSVIDFRNLA